MAQVLGRRAVLLGIGNRWRGDDAAGLAVIDRVSARAEVRCIDAGNAPERHLGEATAGAPDAIILLDAVDFGGAPGEVAVFSPEQLPDRFGTTHDVPLRTLMHYLRTVSRGQVTLVGIQPAVTAFGAGLSPEVSDAVDAVANLLIRGCGGAVPACAPATAAARWSKEEGGERH